MKQINWLLVLILTVGAALRFYGFPHIPFMYDELSAWGRTGYSFFYDLINQGVRGDGHPALIQVFLNYWRKIFGDSEASFKLPFLIMSMCSIWLVFEIGRKWFSETVGIICAAFVAVLQYTVMYGQIARPYASGMFFSLLMVWYWSKYIFEGDRNRKRKFPFAFVIFSILCCYNHYFSLLFAAVVGLSGFFFLPATRWMDYLVAGIVVAVAFLPHFGITTDQFALGGVGGWLAKPDEKFFGNYLGYIFDFSWLMKGMAALLVVLSFLFIPKDWKQKNKLRLLCLFWFLAPMMIGYYYSRHYNPVLQYSVLIFSFPFFLMFIFSLFGNLKMWLQGILVTVILGVGIYSLVYERMHYDIFYKEPVEQMVKYAVQFEKDHPGKKILAMVQEPEKYMGYYLKKWNSNITILSWGDLDFQSYIQSRKFIESHHPDYVLCGNVPFDHLLVIKDIFPKLVEREKGFTYDFSCYTRPNMPAEEIHDLNFADSLNISSPGKFWNVDATLRRTDSLSGRSYLHFDSINEFGCEFKTELNAIMQHRDDILLVDAEVANVSPNAGALLAINFQQNGNGLFYEEKPFNYFLDTNETSGHLIYAMRLRDFDFTQNNPGLKIYLWNKAHNTFDITSMKVEIEKGNPLIYSLIEPIPSYYRKNP